MDGETPSGFYELPHCLSLPDALCVGSSIAVRGNILQNATEFIIDLCCPITCCFVRQIDGKDVALGLRVLFDRRYIGRNSSKKLKWGDEEIANNQSFPLIRGANFFIEIFAAEQEFLIAVNGVHYCTYTIKKALNSIHSLEIEGDIILRSVKVNRFQEAYPSIPPLETENASIISHSLNIDGDSLDCYDLKTPIMCVLSESLEPGNVIRIKAKVKLLPLSFFINLQNSELSWPQPKILLHIEGCYCYSQKKTNKNRLFINSWLNNSWGADIIFSNGCLPMPGSFFTVQIFCEEDQFKIITEGNVIQFPYRESLKGAKIIHIHGDIRVHSISYSSSL